MSKNNAYKFSSYTNIKAVIDFLELEGKTEKDINLFEVWLLSYLVSLYLKENTLKKIMINGEKYVFISDALILDNLKFAPGVRQIKNVISRLEKLGFIKRFIQDRKKRYIAINPTLIDLWKVDGWTITPVSYLMQFEPDKFKFIENNFRPKLKKYNELLERFNENYSLQDKAFDTSLIYKQLFSYLQKCANG